MNELTPRDMRRIELAWVIRTGILGGAFLALAIAPFIEHGRLFARLIIGG